MCVVGRCLNEDSAAIAPFFTSAAFERCSGSRGAIVSSMGDPGRMQFILGVFLFVVVAGGLDARLPWPRPHRKQKP